MLKKIECYVSPKKLDEMKTALIQRGVEGMTISEVKGFGRQEEQVIREKGPAHVEWQDRLKIEIVVDEEFLEPVVREHKRLAWTGASGAGKIFVIPVEEAVRVSTDEAGPLAIY